MNTLWLSWVMGILISISIVYELFVGETRLRGLGKFSRKENAGKYWRSIALKVAILALVLGLGLRISR